MDYTVDAERYLIRMTGSGIVTSDDILNCAKRAHGDSQVKDDMPNLVDMTKVVEMQLDMPALEKVSKMSVELNERQDRAPIAVVTATAGDEYITKLFKALSDLSGVKRDIRTFRDPRGAEAWLGVADL